MGRKPKNTEIFVKEAKQVHGDKYDYSLVNYLNNITKVKIVCPTHGEFKQRPSKHVSNKRGCPKCGIKRMSNKIKNNPNGWTYTQWREAGETSKNFDSFKVYVLRCWNDNEEFYKIGKTFTSLTRRFDSNSKMPYNYELVVQFKGDARSMSTLENKLKMKHRILKYKPKINFRGADECYSEIIEKVYENERE